MGGKLRVREVIGKLLLRHSLQLFGRAYLRENLRFVCREGVRLLPEVEGSRIVCAVNPIAEIRGGAVKLHQLLVGAVGFQRLGPGDELRPPGAGIQLQDGALRDGVLPEYAGHRVHAEFPSADKFEVLPADGKPCAQSAEGIHRFALGIDHGSGRGAEFAGRDGIIHVGADTKRGGAKHRRRGDRDKRDLYRFFHSSTALTMEYLPSERIEK